MCAISVRDRDAVTANQPVLTVVNLDAYEIEFSLPENDTYSRNQAWLADGIAEEVLHALSDLAGLRVAGLPAGSYDLVVNSSNHMPGANAGGFAPTTVKDVAAGTEGLEIVLYNVIGTTYGGDGVTTFALPDLRGRSAVGTVAVTSPGVLGTEFATLVALSQAAPGPNVLVMALIGQRVGGVGLRVAALVAFADSHPRCGIAGPLMR